MSTCTYILFPLPLAAAMDRTIITIITIITSMVVLVSIPLSPLHLHVHHHFLPPPLLYLLFLAFSAQLHLLPEPRPLCLMCAPQWGRQADGQQKG